MSAGRWPELAVEEGLELPPALAKDTREWVARVLDAVFACEGERLALSVFLCGDEEIARLHGAHLGDATATDVISFPLGDEGAYSAELADGELVVGVEFARRACADFGNDWEAELALYLVHGCLHLMGYDDHEERDVARMHAAEKRALEALGYDIASRF